MKSKHNRLDDKGQKKIPINLETGEAKDEVMHKHENDERTDKCDSSKMKINRKNIQEKIGNK